MKAYKTIKKCRLCGHGKFKTIFDMGELYVSNFISDISEEKNKKAPLNLVQCLGCELVQLKDSVDLNSMYKKHYWYRSGLNPVIQKDLKDIVEKSMGMAKLKDGDTVIDIGANDGELLSNYPSWVKRIAIEPAKNLQRYLVERCNEVVPSFWEETDLKVEAKIITAIGMFYDSEDPNIFIKKVYDNLAIDGVFIAQLMTLAPMVKSNDFSNICHEHLEYYSYKNLVKLFEDNGLEIFKVEENGINGGSYRLYARIYLNGSIKYPEKIDLKKFVANVKKNREKVLKFIKNNPREIFGCLGASTKGNTILQYLNPGEKIHGIIDKDSTKFGKMTVGTHIPISPEDLMETYTCLLILPWGFTDFFLEKYKGWMEKGGKFISIIPKFHVWTSTKK